MNGILRPILVLMSLGLSVGALRSAAPDSHGTQYPGRSEPLFPLKLSSDRRYLVDQRDHPFLVVGDSPWSLMVEPTPAQVDQYLDDRAAKGFNLILVNLIEHKFSNHPPDLCDGTKPFLTAGDFGQPNPAYFVYAEDVIRKANRRGIVVLLCPAYLGSGGGDEGFFQEMSRCGPEKLHGYGRYVGKRFRNHPNVIWAVGGDYTPPPDKRWTVEQVAAGIREEDPVHLMTVHNTQSDTPSTIYGGSSWLQLDNVYEYHEELYAFCLKADAQAPRWPYFLVETAYEGEHKSTPDRIRRQAYWPLLCGAFGVVYGNSPLWHFASLGVFDRGGDWVAALNSRGAQDMSRLAALFNKRRWWDLRPDRDHAVVTSGYGMPGKLDYVLTARTRDRRMSLSYLPSTESAARELGINFGTFPARVIGHWFNPTDGQLIQVAGSPFANRDSRPIKSPGDNGTGTSDWLLMLECEDAQSGASVPER